MTRKMKMNSKLRACIHRCTQIPPSTHTHTHTHTQRTDEDETKEKLVTAAVVFINATMQHISLYKMTNDCLH